MFTVYKTTFLLDGRYYIGVHKTDNPNDKYMGSGTHLRSAMKIYGRQNFKKEILFIFEDEESAYLKEAELVTQELVSSGQVFNLISGGSKSPEWAQSRKVARRGKPQPNISRAKREISPLVGNFRIAFPKGVIEDSPDTQIFEYCNDLLDWASLNKFSESTVRHLLYTGTVARQGPLRGVFIERMKTFP
jgi:hypothetical protein